MRSYAALQRRTDQVLELVKKEINERCEIADAISLVTDAWSDQSMQSFLGLGAYLGTSSFNSEIVVLGMVQLTNGSEAEKIKEAIEIIVNEYKFDKSKIRGRFDLQILI